MVEKTTTFPLQSILNRSSLTSEQESRSMIVGDAEKMVAVGLVWGATNVLMRRGAVLWDRQLQSAKSSSLTLNRRHKVFASIRNWVNLLLIWQYSVPFLINISASATFFAILSHTPISLTVPVTNATTFAATAVFGVILGEKTRLGHALLGTALIVLGVWLCIM